MDAFAFATILTWPGHTYPAIALAVVGLLLLVSGGREALRQRRPTNTWPEWALVYLFAFRRVVVGTCLAAAGAAWQTEVGWLFAAAVCVGVGELLESSYYIGVLRWGQRRGSLPTPSA
jgi:hypothetical protein